VAKPAPANLSDPVLFAMVKTNWNKITHSTSRRKITLGTYLQVGYPLAVEEGKLVIGFQKEHSFYRDCLDTPEASTHIQAAVQEATGQACPIVFRIAEGSIERAPTDAIQEALETFGGEVVNEWHNEEDKG
jgi:hypothetical protein